MSDHEHMSDDDDDDDDDTFDNLLVINHYHSRYTYLNKTFIFKIFVIVLLQRASCCAPQKQ